MAQQTTVTITKKVFIVGDDGPEHNSIKSVHRTRAGALAAWNELRLELLEKAKSYLDDKDPWGKDMWQEMVDNLACEDPDKIDNYPWETPYIRECDVKE